MDEKTRSSSTMTNIPPALNLQSEEDGNQKTDQILTNDLLLHEAVYKNETETVRKILRETVNVNSRNNYGRAPIHWAASRGYTTIMELLIESKCDIEVSDKFGMRPVHMAASYGHREAVKMLIDAGANISAVNKKKHTLLMCAARGTSADVIVYLIDVVKNLDVHTVDNSGATAFHHAAAAGNPEGITALSNIPNIKLDTTDQRGQTSLHCACSHGHIDAVEVLIKLGARLDNQDEDGNTPLHVATRGRHTEIAQTLLKSGANVEAVDKLGLTALHVAASQGCNGILQSILQHSSITNIINNQCNIGNTPLHLACENNQADTVEILIKHGAHLNCFNSRLQTAIHIAAEMGHTDVCKLLLAAGANIEQREKSGKTPLYIAARGSFTAIVDMIIRTARLDYPKEESMNRSEQVKRRWKNNEARGIITSSGGENNRSVAEHVRHMLQRLARDELGPGDWKKLALHWDFTHEQIQAIEHQHTGPLSYQEHGYRMLMIWISGLAENEQFLRELHDALLAIERKSIADSIRKLLEQDMDEKDVKRRCDRCSIT